MPAKKSPAPAYRFHVSGQARVTLDGRDFYLGKHGTPESYARYHALLIEYTQNGFKAPGDQPKHQAETAITVRQVAADFRAEVLPKYEHNNGQHNRYHNLLKMLDAKYGDLEADTFGPRILGDIRTGFIKAGCCRRYANMKTRAIVRVFKYAVSRELIKPDRLVALQSLEPLKAGDAHDNDPRQPAALSDVEKTLPELSDTVAAMVKIQLATAMRPSELFRMTPADIDRSGDVWIYRPSDHKTARHGKAKVVPILGDAREALTPYLFGGANKLCFTNYRGTPWNKDTYRRHITRACERAGCHWSPYMLRHAAAQAVRDKLGAEAAQALLGHSRLDMTETYAKASEARAIEAAKVTPRLKA